MGHTMRLGANLLEPRPLRNITEKYEAYALDLGSCEWIGNAVGEERTGETQQTPVGAMGHAVQCSMRGWRGDQPDTHMPQQQAGGNTQVLLVSKAKQDTCLSDIDLASRTAPPKFVSRCHGAH